MILNQGLNTTVSDIRDDMTNGEAGTGITLFKKSDTGVESAIGSTDIALTDKTVSGSTINLTYILSTSLANGSDVAEFEVNNLSIAYSRTLKAATSKTSQDEFSILFTFDFEVVL